MYVGSLKITKADCYEIRESEKKLFAMISRGLVNRIFEILSSLWRV